MGSNLVYKPWRRSNLGFVSFIEPVFVKFLKKKTIVLRIVSNVTYNSDGVFVFCFSNKVTVNGKVFE